MIEWHLVAQPMGIFLVPDDEAQCGASKLAMEAAKATEPAIGQFNPETMMVLPLTIPRDWGDFLFGKITVCSWTGLTTTNVDNVADHTFQDETLAALHVIADRKFRLPVDIPMRPLRFLLGPEVNDDKTNGPITVVRDLEPARGTIDGIRGLLGLRSLHPDSMIHLSMCKLTGRDATGKRDDQLLRSMVVPGWPKLPSGYPAVLEGLPLHVMKKGAPKMKAMKAVAAPKVVKKGAMKAMRKQAAMKAMRVMKKTAAMKAMMAVKAMKAMKAMKK